MVDLASLFCDVDVLTVEGKSDREVVDGQNVCFSCRRN
jgi:hypothetical protein